MKRREVQKSRLQTEKMSNFKYTSQLNFAVLLLHILLLFDTSTPLLSQEASNLISTNITATINSPVTLQCFVHNPHLTIWLMRRKWCGHSSALTLGGYNLKNETYSLRIGKETGRTTYNLIVNQPSNETEGTYICQERGINKVFATLQVDTDDPTDKTMTVVVNSTVEMHCIVENSQYAHWLFSPSETTGTPVTLSSAGSVFNTHDYSLVIQQTEGFSTYNLIIYNTTDDMQGIYSCREQGVSKADVTLIVEGLPEVWIEKDGAKLSRIINVTVDKIYDLTCIASGDKTPQGWFSWERNSRNLSDKVTYQESENEVSSILSYRPLAGDTRLTCIFSRQIAVASIKVVLQVNVLYPPYCNLSTSINNQNQLLVYCSCVGNPKVSTVYIIVNDSLHTTDEVTISSVYPVYLKCFAENGLEQLSNKPTYKYQPPPINPITIKESQFPIRWVITILSFILLLLCLLLVIIILRKKRYVSFSYFTWEPTVSRITTTMSERPPCRSPPTQHRFLSTASEYYETVPVTGIKMESDGVSTDEQVEYNAQYFDLPRDDSEEKVYAEPDKEDQENVCIDAIAEYRESTASCFSDSEYFGPLSEGGTLDKKVRLLDVKYKLKGQ